MIAFIPWNELKLVYFEGCPNLKPAVDFLDSCGVRFSLIRQDDLNMDDPLKGYSSPTLISGKKIVFGAQAIGGGCSMTLSSIQELQNLLGLDHQS